MILTEYDEEKRIKSEKLQSYDEGWRKLLIQQVIAKFQKGLSCGEIADMLEVDTATIQPIYDLIKANPEMDIDTIYEQLYIYGDY